MLVRWSLHEHEVTVERGQPAAADPERVRLAARPDQLRRALAARHPLPAADDEEGRRRAPAARRRSSAALRAASDPTRLRILRLVGERPRSTEELAPLVGLSESGLSKHLRALTDAGLLTTRRQGWYVLYDLERERLDRARADDAASAYVGSRP